MAEVLIEARAEEPQRGIGSRGDWALRLLNELFAFFVALLFALAGLIVLLDSAPGHRFIVDQLSGSNRLGPAHSHRPYRRLDFRQVAAEKRQDR